MIRSHVITDSDGTAYRVACTVMDSRLLRLVAVAAAGHELCQESRGVLAVGPPMAPPGSLDDEREAWPEPAKGATLEEARKTIRRVLDEGVERAFLGDEWVPPT